MLSLNRALVKSVCVRIAVKLYFSGLILWNSLGCWLLIKQKAHYPNCNSLCFVEKKDCKMYRYKARVVKVVDGDTIDCDVDLGFYMTARIRFRLFGIDAPEVRGAERGRGKEVRQWLIELFNNSQNECEVATTKTGKYGRWLAVVYIPGLPVGTSVNGYMVSKGFATEYGK